MKKITSVILITILILLLSPAFSMGFGAAAINTDPSDLTVIIMYDETPLSGLKVEICRVADAADNGGEAVYTTAAAFSGMELDFSDLTTAEKNIALAALIDAYALTNKIERERKTTESNGRVKFSNLSAGIYLVSQADKENSEYIIAPYLAFVPSPTENKGWDHNVISRPKSKPVKRIVEETTLPPETTTAPPETTRAPDTTFRLPDTSTRPPDGPKTEDTSDMSLWTALFIFGFAGLFVTTVAFNSKRLFRGKKK